MDVEKIIQEMSFEEKAQMLTGIDDMKTSDMDKYGICAKTMADGPHGVGLEAEKIVHLRHLGTQKWRRKWEARTYDCIELGPRV